MFFTSSYYLLGLCALVLISPVLAYLLWWFLTPIRQSFSNPPAHSYRHSYRNTATNEDEDFPSVHHDHGADVVRLSLIVPAYNEEDRIEVMLNETLPYLEGKQKADKEFTYEIIVVDDGSRDKTTEIAQNYARKRGSDVFRVMTLKKNQGKGGAVQQGMLHARGKYLLMVDADGATEIKDLDRLLKQMSVIEDSKTGYGIVVGSRAHLQEKAVAKRKWYRSILMHGFHWLVYTLAVKSIKDTQCGFKLFTRKSAQILFSNLNLRRWCFDVELLYMAESLNMPLKEVAVNWQEIPGSKLRVLEAALLMGRDLVIIRACHTFGVWRITKPGKREETKKQR
mmetsp:Transcript_32401/g.45173  ORF Transcript_32401/g.45173 Transcript_32401/m.45173 type:complete len:338 (-) Transcript_32401:175-1188(-)